MGMCICILVIHLKHPATKPRSYMTERCVLIGPAGACTTVAMRNPDWSWMDLSGYVAINQGDLMNNYFSRLAILTGTTLLSIGAMAQSTAPAGVGTTPQTAAEATRKAVPRADTGTVVRTAPSAADRARQANATAPAANSDSTPAASTGSTAGMDARSRPGRMRPARADRN